jgi:hypothetical protein
MYSLNDLWIDKMSTLSNNMYSPDFSDFLVRFSLPGQWAVQKSRLTIWGNMMGATGQRGVCSSSLCPRLHEKIHHRHCS